MSAADAKPPSNSAVVEVSRPDDFNGRWRRMKVRCDGVTQLRVSAKSPARFVVESGTHVLRASMDWAASPSVTVQVNPGQTVRLRTSLPLNPFEIFYRPRSCVNLEVVNE